MASDMQPLADRSISTDADLPKEPVNQNLRETEKDPSCMSDSTRVSSSSTREESNSQISPRETETFEDKKKIISLVKSSKCLEELRRIAKLVQQGTVCIDLATDREVSFDLFILVAQVSRGEGISFQNACLLSESLLTDLSDKYELHQADLMVRIG